MKIFYFILLLFFIAGNANAKEIVQKEYQYHYETAKTYRSEMYVVSKHDRPGTIKKSDRQELSGEVQKNSESNALASQRDKKSFSKKEIIYFDLNESTLKESEMEKLKSLTTYKIAGKINLIGYTCELGSLEYNESLAQERAESVKQFLTTMGTTNCQAYSKPKCCYVSSSDLAQNRRVEIYYTEIPLAGVTTTTTTLYKGEKKDGKEN